eukprot:scaffold15.g4236.t1
MHLWQAGPATYLLRSPGALTAATGSSSSPTYVLEPGSEAAAAALRRLHAAVQGSSSSGGGRDGGGAAGNSQSHFDTKTDKGSADLYFHYYGMLQHQQNMLQDYIRTGTYYAAILENGADFAGAWLTSITACQAAQLPWCSHCGCKAVMDVGCGSGILSLFAAQAGARVVYAVEASDMALFARQLAAANPEVGQRIRVLHGKVEEVEVPEQVDVLVSEPMGTLLVNERMIESFLYARDRFLKPGGKMYPRLGRIHLAAFCDELLHGEVAQKALFFTNSAFYGVDLTCLQAPAAAGYFSQVVVDQIPPNVLVSNCVTKTFDFATCGEAELQDISIPISVAVPCTVHGIASWFDVLFDGSQSQRWLSTAPGLPITHWFQLRCVLDAPLVISRPGATVSGELLLRAHARQSYDVALVLRAPPTVPGDAEQESRGTYDLKEPYYRQLAAWVAPPSDAVATGPLAATPGSVTPAQPPAQQAAQGDARAAAA